MFTLDEIKTILDADGALTIDGYNLIRTNLMTKLEPVINEVEELNTTIKSIKEENDRLKQANAALYTKIEAQIMNHKKLEEPDNENENTDELTPDESLNESVKDYSLDI